MSSSLTASALLTESEEMYKEKTFKIAFLITLPVFMGYACCFSLQHRLSKVFGLTDGASGDKTSQLYGFATSFVFLFNLIFRVLGHNLAMACASPKYRVIISLCSMIIAMIMISFLSYSKTPPSIAWVFISYAFAGVCEGSYGPNILNVVNHMGDTRLYVVMAMPCGVACISLVAFALMGFGCPFQIFYIITACLLACSIIIYFFTVFPEANRVQTKESNFNLKDFWGDCKEICQWFPKIAFVSIVFFFNMMCLSLFNPGCTLYTYQERVTFRLFGFTLSHDTFIMIYNLGSFLGDFVSRKVMNKKRIINPIWYFLLLVFAFIINISLIPEIAPFAAFGFSWANGGLYVQSTKFIGSIFQDKYHLTATSTWLFIGDAGSTIGSNLVQPMRPIIASIKKKMF
jgi:hypothetical protein